MLHYNPQHVSSSTLLVLRRTNFIITASGIVTLCKQPYSMPIDSGLQEPSTFQIFGKRVEKCSNAALPKYLSTIPFRNATFCWLQIHNTAREIINTKSSCHNWRHSKSTPLKTSEDWSFYYLTAGWTCLLSKLFTCFIYLKVRERFMLACFG